MATLLTSCNFGDSSDETSGGGLFSGHKPVFNKFTVNLPSAQTFNSAEHIDIVLTHSFAVTVAGGTPRLALTIGSNTEYANFLSGSSTNNLTFRYTVQPGDQDSDGIQIDNTLDLNGATIQFLFEGLPENAETLLGSSDASNILVGDPGPTVLSVSLPADNVYTESQNLDLTLSFNQIVTVAGNPRIPITLSSGIVFADYVSGSGSSDVMFRYTVANGDEDLNGITLSSVIDLNSGTIQSGSALNAILTFTSGSTSNINVDALAPTVTITSAPNIIAANATSYSANGTCSEEGQVVTVNIGGTDYLATCSSNTWDTGSLDLSGMIDVDPLNINANLDDVAGNSATQATLIRLKDTDVPDISSNIIAANTYITDAILSMDILFDQAVIVSGSPRVQLTFDTHVTNPVYLSYNSGSASNTLTFTYTVVSGEEDLNGIDLAANIDLNTGLISDINGNASTLNLATVNFGSVLVITNGPSITSLIEPVNATYPEAAQILLQINYDEAVIVTGSPRIALDIGGTTRYAVYSSGSSTSGLEFSYTIQATEVDPDGIDITATSIDLSAGTIVSSGTGNPAGLNFTVFKDPTTGVLVDTASGITPPDQVIGLSTAPTTSSTSLGLSWAVPTDNGTSLINYSAQYREIGDSTWITVSPNPTTNATTVNGLTAGITYEFRVAANNGLLGNFSAVQTAEIFDVMSLNPIAWLDASNINGDGTSPTNGTKIDSWVDLTGAATNATELTPANQPTIEYNAQNNLPSVRFENHAVGLQGTFTRSIGTDLTFIVVGQFDNGYTDKCLFEFKGPGSERGFFIDRRYASNTNYSPVLTKDSFQMWRIEDDGSAATVTENSSTQMFSGATMFGTDFTGTGTYVLGDDATGGNRMYGYISEFLVFDKALTPAEITTIETYLKSKWGTP